MLIGTLIEVREPYLQIPVARLLLPRPLRLGVPDTHIGITAESGKKRVEYRAEISNISNSYVP